MNNEIYNDIIRELNLKSRVMQKLLDEFKTEREEALQYIRQEIAEGKIPSMFDERAAYASIRWAKAKIDAYETAIKVVEEAFGKAAKQHKNTETNQIMKDSA